jgi:hypothetical protein
MRSGASILAPVAVLFETSSGEVAPNLTFLCAAFLFSYLIPLLEQILERPTYHGAFTAYRKMSSSSRGQEQRLKHVI